MYGNSGLESTHASHSNTLRMPRPSTISPSETHIHLSNPTISSKPPPHHKHKINLEKFQIHNHAQATENGKVLESVDYPLAGESNMASLRDLTVDLIGHEK